MYHTEIPNHSSLARSPVVHIHVCIADIIPWFAAKKAEKKKKQHKTCLPSAGASKIIVQAGSRTEVVDERIAVAIRIFMPSTALISKVR